MKTSSWISILGAFALAACGEAAGSSESAPEAAKDPQVNASMTNASIATQSPAAVAAQAELVAVPRGIQVSDAEAEANGPPPWLRNRQRPPAGVVIDQHDESMHHELEPKVGR